MRRNKGTDTKHLRYSQLNHVLLAPPRIIRQIPMKQSSRFGAKLLIGEKDEIFKFEKQQNKSSEVDSELIHGMCTSRPRLDFLVNKFSSVPALRNCMRFRTALAAMSFLEC